MRFTVSEKQELIKMVVESDLGVNRTLREIGLNKSTFYKWYKSYSDHGVEGLESVKRDTRRQWNSIPQVYFVKLKLTFQYGVIRA